MLVVVGAAVHPSWQLLLVGGVAAEAPRPSDAEVAWLQLQRKKATTKETIAEESSLGIRADRRGGAVLAEAKSRAVQRRQGL